MVLAELVACMHLHFFKYFLNQTIAFEAHSKYFILDGVGDSFTSVQISRAELVKWQPVAI